MRGNLNFTLQPIDTSYYIAQASADMFNDYRFMFITMTIAIGIALLIATSCAKRDHMTPKDFFKLFWIELLVIVSICGYGVWSLFHIAKVING